MIKIEHLVKKYGDRYAVNDISFEVHPGEIVAFVLNREKYTVFSVRTAREKQPR